MSKTMIPKESPILPENLRILSDPAFQELQKGWSRLAQLRRAQLLQQLFREPHSMRRVARLLIVDRGSKRKHLDEGTIRNYRELASLSPEFHNLLARGTPMIKVLKQAHEAQVKQDIDLRKQLNIQEGNPVDDLFFWIVVWVEEYGIPYRTAEAMLKEARDRAGRTAACCSPTVHKPIGDPRKLMARTRPINLEKLDFGPGWQADVNWLGSWAIRLHPDWNVVTSAFGKAYRHIERVPCLPDMSHLYEPGWLDYTIEEDGRRQREEILWARAHMEEVFRNR